MRPTAYLTAAISAAAGFSVASPLSTAGRVIAPRTDTVFVKVEPRIDYDELTSRIMARMPRPSPDQRAAQVIEGDLIVKGRLSVGGMPEPGTTYAVTIRGDDDATVRFISNEALHDGQRVANQHRHVGTLGLAQDGGLRLEQNSTCYTDARGCTADDKARRHAYSGFDSMGDLSFYLSDVDSASGRDTAPRAQNLVFRLIAWDGNIHFDSHRPAQRIFFNGSTTLNAADLQWEVPLR